MKRKIAWVIIGLTAGSALVAFVYWEISTYQKDGLLFVLIFPGLVVFTGAITWALKTLTDK